MNTVLVTGANGFVGHSLLLQLEGINFWHVRGAVRCGKGDLLHNKDVVEIGDLGPDTIWEEGLHNVDVVVHTAARAHVMTDTRNDAMAEYRRVNVEATASLAQQAASQGVRRFIFVSSIGVNGNTNTVPFQAKDEPDPADFYSISKYEAEKELRKIAQQTGLEVVIIRPPLIYGANAPGNFGKLVKWVRKGVPLPLGGVRNRRSLVGLDNLLDLIVTCIDHPNATDEVFLVSDGEDISTSELLLRVGRAMGRPARLLPVPVWFLKAGAAILGRRDLARRLLGSLQVDISRTCDVLDWTPPITVDEGLRRAVAHFNDR
jgi:nucleoside-diphosphate-sugar epimerase